MSAGPGRSLGAAVAAVVVDYRAGSVLADCVGSLRAEGIGQIVVVENGDPSAASRALPPAWGTPVVHPGRNLGYGAGVNRGVAATGETTYVLVCNPDLRVHEGAIGALVGALDAEPSWAIVGPTVLTPEGVPYPSVRRFPSMVDAAGHAALGHLVPDNPFTRRYRSSGAPGHGLAMADWVSGACFLVRRRAFEELGGFDEAYFMFAEDMDLCWRAHRGGVGGGVATGRRGHPHPGSVDAPAPVPDAARPPPLGAALRLAIDRGLASGRAPARRGGSRGPSGGHLRGAHGPLALRGDRAVASARAACGSVVESRSQSQAKRPT